MGVQVAGEIPSCCSRKMVEVRIDTYRALYCCYFADCPRRVHLPLLFGFEKARQALHEGYEIKRDSWGKGTRIRLDAESGEAFCNVRSLNHLSIADAFALDWRVVN